MRKSFTILMLLCFSVQITGYHLYFHIRQIDIKRAVKKRIRRRADTSLTEQFVFSLHEENKENGPVWINEHEFTFHGAMYDVVEKTSRNGKIYIRCINDKKETGLLNYYKDLVKKDFGDKSKKRATHWLKLISGVYLSINNLLDGLIKVHSIRPCDPRILSLSPVMTEVPTPPPQTAG